MCNHKLVNKSFSDQLLTNLTRIKVRILRATSETKVMYKSR